MALKLVHLHKSYPAQGGAKPVKVLENLELELEPQQSLAIIGQSGSGKSTLLSLIAGLDRPDQGQVILGGQDLTQLNQRALSLYRAKNLGIVFQQFHLMPHLTALENVALPLELLRRSNPKREAQKMLDAVGLGERLGHFPGHLSGGECQRVAIARALVVKPSLLLADEPTGNLDEKTGQSLSHLLFELAESQKMTLLLVTHNKELAKACKTCLSLSEGALHVV